MHPLVLMVKCQRPERRPLDLNQHSDLARILHSVKLIMGTNSLSFYVGVKGIFCLVLVATPLANSFLTPNLYTSILDETRNDLMSYSLSSRARTPTPRPTERRGGVIFRRIGSVQPGTTPPPPKQTANNKFLGALDEIQRAMYEAQAAGSRYHHSTRRLAKIKENIKLATQKRSYLFARQALGRSLYSVTQLAKESGRKRRTAPDSPVKSFMDSVKKELRGSSFDTLLGVKGDVTLMFAIDDTGSMSDEIQAAKDIATAIVNHPREEPVDYILSPYNDPETGPVTYKPDGEGSQFVIAINSLRAHDGDDCPELAFQGIREAMREGPLPFSPLYVFTDAPAKDYAKYDEVLHIALDNDITINFFTTGMCDGTPYEPYERLARETCGHVFKLTSSYELKNLTGFTAGALAGATCQDTGEGGDSSLRRKRSVNRSTYSIAVDDTTEKVIIPVTTDMGPNITLRDPRGHIFTSGKISLSNGAIYEMNNPQPGIWKLTVSSAGKHSYQVKGSSNTNVDFGYFFVMIPTRGRNKKPVPISHPLLGQRAFVIISVAGAEKINESTLHLELTNNKGTHLGTIPVTPDRTSGARFSASFSPPPAPFKLKLKGKTKRGYNLERSSRKIVYPSHALIRVLYARNEFTVPAGGSGFVLFVVYNTGRTEKFDVKIKDSMEFVHSLPHSSILVRQGRKNYVSVTFNAPRSAERGKVGEVLATITGQTSKKTVSQVVRLMVV